MARRSVSTPDYLATVAFFSGVATLALLLTTLCVPFDKSLYIFRLSAIAFGQTRNVDFGVFGYCPASLTRERNGDFPAGVVPRCLKPTLGWVISSDLVKLMQAPDTLASTLSRQVTSVLVIYPLAAGLSFVSFLVACIIYRRRRAIKRTESHELPPDSVYYKVVGYFVQIALATASAALFANIVVISVMKTRVNTLHNVNDSLQLKWGNLIVVNVIAWLFLLLATVYAHKLQKPPPPVVLMPETEQVAQSNNVPPVTFPQPQPFVAAPAYKASQADRLLEQGQSEQPPTYDTAVHIPSPSASSQPEPPGTTPLVADSNGGLLNLFRLNRRT